MCIRDRYISDHSYLLTVSGNTFLKFIFKVYGVVVLIRCACDSKLCCCYFSNIKLIAFKKIVRSSINCFRLILNSDRSLYNFLNNLRQNGCLLYTSRCV